jgi:hypothetical protein
MRPITFVLIIFLLLTALARPSPLAATSHLCTFGEQQWLESRTSYFVVVTLPEDRDLGQYVSSHVVPELQRYYERASQLFDTSLLTPIVLRFYPNRQQYHCLNPLTAELPSQHFYNRLGVREIAFISDESNWQQANWEVELLNNLRYELTLIFVEQLSQGKGPPGLQAGVGVYAQDPHVAVGQRLAFGSESQIPQTSWRFLWENPEALQDRATAFQSMTIVAYLVDVYGWSAFRQFLKALATSESYRSALLHTYGIELTEMQVQWQLYYPFFFDGRWRANVFYGFELDTFEQLLAAGAYADAVEGLREAIVFLESLAEQEKVAEAEVLLSRAEVGLEAAALVRQARQALLRKEYERTITLTDQAQEKYQSLGDRRRLDEVEAYRSWAQEVLETRQTITPLRQQALVGGETAAIDQLLGTWQRLAELGDPEGAAQVEQILHEIEVMEQERASEMVGQVLLVCILLLLLRVLLMWRRRPPEAQLL